MQKDIFLMRMKLQRTFCLFPVAVVAIIILISRDQIKVNNDNDDRNDIKGNVRLHEAQEKTRDVTHNSVRRIDQSPGRIPPGPIRDKISEPGSVDIELSTFQNISFSLISQMENSSVRDASEDYFIISNVVVPSRSFSEPEVTLVTHGSADRLIDLMLMLRYWDGPISVSVFIYKGIELGAVQALAKIIMCEKVVRQRVRIHIVYPVLSAPAFLSLWLKIIASEVTCQNSLSSLLKRSASFDLGSVQYPVNLLRNIALKHATTGFVLNIDMDVFPNKHARRDFLKNDVIWRQKDEFEKVKELNKEVYVLPCFEVESNLNKINDKRELLEAVDKSWSVPCRINFFAPGHRATDFNKWMSLPFESDSLDKAFEVQYEANFEPYFIARREGFPLFNEEFKSYGFDKNTQMCEIYMAGYSIHVLNNAFVLHPGVKKSSDLSQKHKQKMRANYRIALKFQQQLKKKYGKFHAKACV